MAILNREVRAVQNPALGAMMLWRSCSGYHRESQTAAPIPLPLLFLVLPICLHRETAELLSSTQRQSGLRKFVEKFHVSANGKTDLVLAIAGRARTMRPVTLQAVFPLSTVPPQFGIAHSVRPLLSSAEKLGAWFARLSLYEIQLLLQVKF